MCVCLGGGGGRLKGEVQKLSAIALPSVKIYGYCVVIRIRTFDDANTFYEEEKDEICNKSKLCHKKSRQQLFTHSPCLVLLFFLFILFLF